MAHKEEDPKAKSAYFGSSTIRVLKSCLMKMVMKTTNGNSCNLLLILPGSNGKYLNG